MRRKTEHLMICAVSLVLFACMCVNVFAGTEGDTEGA